MIGAIKLHLLCNSLPASGKQADLKTFFSSSEKHWRVVILQVYKPFIANSTCGRIRMNSFKVTLVSIFFFVKSVDHQHGNSTTKIKQEKFETNQDRKIWGWKCKWDEWFIIIFWQTHALIITFRISLCVW